MKNVKALSIIALLVVLIIGGFLAYGYYKKATYNLKRPIVTMEIKKYGTVKIELYPDMAPNTVKNFIKLINDGYYNGLTFHRVEEEVIQGGDTAGDGSGQSDFTLNGEFSMNGYEDNTLSFERGTLGLEREDYTYYSSLDKSLTEKGYNSGYAQFFITAKDDSASFDGYYTAFGKVVEGMDIIDKITKIETKVETNEETGEKTTTSTPVNAPVISNMTVETFGVEYGEPILHERFDANSYINYLVQQMYGLSY